MTNRSQYQSMTKDQLFDTLRREILAARVKVTLDEQLGRPTSDIVKRLANMILPPIVKTPIHEHCTHCNHCNQHSC